MGDDAGHRAGPGAWTDCQASEQLAAGQEWQDTGLVFTTCHGAALDAGNVRKMFKRACTAQLRTSFVSLMSHRGVSIEEIARLVAGASTRTTEIVYRRELRPVITTGAEIMDQLFTQTQPPPQPDTRPEPAQPGRRTPATLPEPALPAPQPTAIPAELTTITQFDYSSVTIDSERCFYGCQGLLWRA